MTISSMCTLPSEKQPLRLAEFERLVGAHRSRTSWQDDRTAILWFAGDEVLGEVLRDLARRESECCSFFAFEVHGPRDGEVCLQVRVSRRHRRVLRGFVEAIGQLA